MIRGPLGIAAYEARNLSKTGVYAFEREQPAELAAKEIMRFKNQALAWEYFDSAPPSCRRVITHWVVSAKRAATRERRLQQLKQACSERRSILK